MKKLIKQYVGTGIKLPAEQVTKLPNWAKNLLQTKNNLSRC